MKAADVLKTCPACGRFFELAGVLATIPIHERTGSHPRGRCDGSGLAGLLVPRGQGNGREFVTEGNSDGRNERSRGRRSGR
jgi:hypothetical protein